MKKTVMGLIATQGIIMCFTLFVVNGHRVNTNSTVNRITGLTEDYELYVNKSDAFMATSLLNITETDRYLLLSRDDFSSTIGFYDPTQYLTQQRIDVGFGVSRGINFQEYTQGNRVGIKAVEQNYPECARSSDVVLESIAFCIDPYTNLYEKGIDYYLNVFSLNYFGKYVYLDLSKKDIDRVKSLFLENGYQRVEKADSGLLTAHLTVFSGKFTTSSLRILSIAMQGIYLFTMIFYFMSKKSEIRIHYYYGGSPISIFCKQYATTWMQILGANAILLGGMHLLYANGPLSYMTLSDYIMTLIGQWIFIMMIWLNGYLITYHQMRKEVAKDAKKH